MNKREIIENFIHQFIAFGDDVRKCFSNGMCYHFTTLLRARFGDDCRVMYDPIINHFATEIDDRIYDITGDITDNGKYKFVYWDSYKYNDLKEAQRIYRDCIYQVPNEIVLCGLCGHCYRDYWGTLICDLYNKPVNFDDNCSKEE